MASIASRNSPRSARRARDKDSVKRIGSSATGSDDADLATITDVVAALQAVDFKGLQRRLKNLVPRDLKNQQDGQDASIRCAEKGDWERKYIDLKEKYDELDAAHKEIKRKNKKQLEEKEKEFKSLLDERNQRLLECHNELKSQEKAMKDIKRAKDEALIRLSQQMGLKMLEGNPYVTNLSDQNRPTKLAEIYSELYDNEWTNAFEALTQTFQKNEQKAIQLLLKILRESSKHASDLSQSNMKTIEKLISGSSKEPSPDCKRLLREARKHVNIEKAEDHIQAFVKGFASWEEGAYMSKGQVDIYSKKCFQFCWLMSIQDPPVVLSKDPQRGARFDTNVYKPFTHSGHNFDYVVWPALLLHNDGPLLAKGVAQPCSLSKANSTPTLWRPTTKDAKSFDGKSDEKESVSASVYDRKDKKQDEYQTRGDGAISSKSGSFRKSKYSTYSTRSIPPNDMQDFELKQKFQRIQERWSKNSTEQV